MMTSSIPQIDRVRAGLLRWDVGLMCPSMPKLQHPGWIPYHSCTSRQRVSVIAVAAKMKA
jgi:hypothetical protein